jgi:hypothetical protein
MPALDRSGEGLRIESPDLFRLFRDTRDFDKKLYAQLRKAMREAGRPLVEDIRAEIMRIPSSGRHRGGIRSALAAGTNVSIGAASERSAGITVRTSTRRLPHGKRSLGRAFNKATFRHPVFARAWLRRNRIKWVQQPGRPYFGATVARHYPDVQERLRAAFLAATDDLQARGGAL